MLANCKLCGLKLCGQTARRKYRTIRVRSVSNDTENERKKISRYLRIDQTHERPLWSRGRYGSYHVDTGMFFHFELGFSVMSKVNYVVIAAAVVAEKMTMAQVCERFNVTAQESSVKAGLTKYRRLYDAIGQTGCLHQFAETGTAPVKVEPVQPVSDNVRAKAKAAARTLSDAYCQLFGREVRTGRGRERFDPLAALDELGLLDDESDDDTPLEGGDDAAE